MKKVIPILLALLILLTSTCFAAYEPDPNRWMSLYADDEITEYLDVKTLQYSADGNMADFWICYVQPKENVHRLVNQKLDKSNRTLTLIHTTKYDSVTNNVLDSIDIPLYMQKPIKITPGSVSEFYYDVLFVEIPRLASEYKQKENSN